jgi:hypothetical protein
MEQDRSAALILMQQTAVLEVGHQVGFPLHNHMDQSDHVPCTCPSTLEARLKAQSLMWTAVHMYQYLKDSRQRYRFCRLTLAETRGLPPYTGRNKDFVALPGCGRS